MNSCGPIAVAADLITMPVKKNRVYVIGIFAALIIFTLIGLVSLFSTRKLLESESWSRKTLMERVLLEEVFSFVKDAETGQRGYILTGDWTYLDPYYDGITAVHKSLREVKQLPAYGKDNKKHVDALERLIRERFAQLHAAIKTRKEKGLDPARASLASGTGRALMKEIRQLVDSIKRETENRLQAQYEASQKQARQTMVTIVCGNCIAFLLILFNGFNLLRAWRQRRMVEQEIAWHRNQLEEIVIDRTAELRETNRQLTQEIEDRKLAEAEKIDLEKRLARSKKMEALGTLAGGVAHDLNNLLSGLVSYPELMLLDLPADSPLRKPLGTIKKSGEHAANIVQDLLTLARRGVVVTQTVNLSAVIDGYLKSSEFNHLQSNHPKISIMCDLDPGLMNLKGSPVHLAKTIMNLVINASESMPEGGVIRVETRNEYIDRPLAGYDAVAEGDYAIVTIADTGIGISEQDMERIFEPFYTKKVMGQSGTGLGMAVVWGTVKDHKGYVDIQSREGVGTTVKIYFPATRDRVVEDTAILSIEELMGHSERILVVDDIAEQQDIAAVILNRLGYRVKTVSSGEAAIEYLAKNRVDLVLLDMIMDPGMDGLNTYREILKRHPGQKAIIASGFSETGRVKAAQKLGAGKYIRKPYSIEKIGQAVKEELES